MAPLGAQLLRAAAAARSRPSTAAGLRPAAIVVRRTALRAEPLPSSACLFRSASSSSSAAHSAPLPPPPRGADDARRQAAASPGASGAAGGAPISAGVAVAGGSAGATASSVAAIEATLRPTPEQLREMDEVVAALDGICERLGGFIRCYGSCESGTWIQGSDVDVTWIYGSSKDVPMNIRKAWEIGMLQQMRAQVEAAGLELIARTSVVIARVPVLKLHGHSGEVLCDVTMNNFEGVRNTLLVQALCRESQALAPLVRLLKYWSRRRDIGDRFQGGFSSYTLVLMAAFYVQSSTATSAMEARGSLAMETIERLCGQIPSGDVDLSKYLSSAEGRLAAFTQNESRLFSPFSGAAQSEEEVELARLLAGFFQLFAEPEFAKGRSIELIAPPAPPVTPPPPPPREQGASASLAGQTSSASASSASSAGATSPEPTAAAQPPPPPASPSTLTPPPPPPKEPVAPVFVPPPPAAEPLQVQSATGSEPNEAADVAQPAADDEPSVQAQPTPTGPALPPLPPPPPPENSVPPPPPPQSALPAACNLSLQVRCPLTGLDVQRSSHGDWLRLSQEIRRAFELLASGSNGVEVFDQSVARGAASQPAQPAASHPSQPPPPTTPPPAPPSTPAPPQVAAPPPPQASAAATAAQSSSPQPLGVPPPPPQQAPPSPPMSPPPPPRAPSHDLPSQALAVAWGAGIEEARVQA